MSTLNADDFARQLTLVVPTRVLPKIGQVYFDAATQLHAAIVEPWPVDTGYSRASWTASEGDGEPEELPPRNDKASYVSRFGASDAAAATAIGTAAKNLTPLTIGCTADYAPYVEDRVNVVKAAVNEWSDMVQRAIENADGGAIAEAAD